MCRLETFVCNLRKQYVFLHLQIATESSLSERARLEQRIEDVESLLRTVESEREELLVRLASLKDDNKVQGLL